MNTKKIKTETMDLESINRTFDTTWLFAGLVIVFMLGVIVLYIVYIKDVNEKENYCKEKFGNEFFMDINHLRYSENVFACCKINENNDIICKYVKTGEIK